jgi:hypothetical protein
MSANVKLWLDTGRFAMRRTLWSSESFTSVAAAHGPTGFVQPCVPRIRLSKSATCQGRWVAL